MSYCLNPFCQAPQNLEVETCVCGFELRLNDRYRAVRLIGQGGFGRTFLAIDESQSEKPPCVVKQFAPQSQASLAQAAALFEQEALRLKELGEHPQIPALLNHCQQAGYQYLVQEFIDGQNLAQELHDRGTFTQTEIEKLLFSILPVLQFIHDRGVIHRDIKPENIIRRCADEQWVLVDFGAAKQATGTALLKTGTTIGSAEFIAPEQARGKATFASDLYSLGVTCIHLLTQVSPFDLIDGSNQWVWRDWLKENTVSEELGYLLDKMVAVPNQRFQSAAEVLAFLKDPQLPKPEASVVEKISDGRSLRKQFVFAGIATFALGTIVAAISISHSINSVDQAAKAKQAQAKYYVEILTRTQEEYFYQHGEFDNSPKYIGEIKIVDFAYTYLNFRLFKTLDGYPAFQQTALPYGDGLKAYIQITVAVTEQHSTVGNFGSIRCESKQPNFGSRTVPEPPELRGNTEKSFQCPAGYSRLSWNDWNK
ncbi:protein kinase domain-containing protein [Phormidesmis sp. 146-33]